ncbi:MAG: hypothetical protein J0M12_10665 [Deltaproteobacteria bacterium]|nr:hypothetical protein [Deltaproteobacteria bacterium]
MTPTQVACTTIDNAQDLTTLDSRSMEQRDLIINQAKKAAKQGYLSAKQQAKFTAAAKAGYVVAWSAVWTIPSVVKECESSPTCVQVSLEGDINTYIDKSEDLKDLADSMAVVIKKKGGKKQAEYVVRHAKALHEQNILTTKKLPKTESICS